MAGTRAEFTVDENAPRYLGSKLLIAAPHLMDPRFERTVILLGSHDEHHAMGLIVNKTLPDLKFSELLEFIDLPVEPELDHRNVHYGGPVNTDKGLVVHTLDYQTPATLKVTDAIGVTGSKEILKSIASTGATEKPEKWFLALGHAGWSGRQLETEISENAWAHCPADPDIVFSGGSEDAWSNAYSAIGVSSAMLTPDWFAGRDDAILH